MDNDRAKSGCIKIDDLRFVQEIVGILIPSGYNIEIERIFKEWPKDKEVDYYVVHYFNI